MNTKYIGNIDKDLLARNPVRLALFDIDGTLVHGTDSIPQIVVDQVKRVQEKGIPVALATGRSFFSSRWVAERIGNDQPGMFCSGSIFARPISGEVIHADYLDAKVTLEFIKIMECEGYYTELYTKDGFFIEKETAYTPIHQKYMIGFNPTIGSLITAAAQPLLKLVIMVEQGPKVKRLHDILKEFPSYAVAVSTGHADHQMLFFNITNISASRERAFDFFVKHYGVEAPSIASFGDSESDVVFLSRAGYGVALENAPESVKEKASYITGHVEDSGVAQALKILVPE